MYRDVININFYSCLFCRKSCSFQTSDMISSWWKCYICEVEFQTKHLSQELMSVSFSLSHEGEIYYMGIDYSKNNTEIYKLGSQQAVVIINQATQDVVPGNVKNKLLLYLVFS